MEAVLRAQATAGAERMVRPDAPPERGITVELGEGPGADSHAEMAVLAHVVRATLAEQAAAEATGTEATDNDRLDRAFAALEAGGILARQDPSDCGSGGLYRAYGAHRAEGAPHEPPQNALSPPPGPAGQAQRGAVVVTAGAGSTHSVARPVWPSVTSEPT